MYHFVSEQTPELRLATNVLVSSQTTQYLKSFQLEAVQFIYERLSKHQFCIYNDESGLGKSAAVVALLSALEPAKKKTLIVMQNDDRLLSGWQFHFDILTDLPVYVIQDVKDSTESPHSVYLAKWSVLRNIGDLSRFNFDLVIVDNRGHTLNNNFCTSMLFKHYEKKVNLVISSVDITSETKLLYNILRLGGCLENQYRTYRSFERKFHLPDAKEVFQKKVDLEEYYKQRGFLGEYIRDYRLRRYRHQFDQYLPLVSVEHYNNNLKLWLTANNSESTLSGSTLPTISSSDARSTAGTDEIMECIINLKRVREGAQEPEKLSEHSDEVLAMSPLVFEMSEPEEEDRQPPIPAPPTSQAVFTVSSDDCEMVTPQKRNKRVPSTPTTKRKAKKRLVPLKPLPVEISESEVEMETVKHPSPVLATRNVNIRLRRTTIATPQSNAIRNTVSPKSEPKVVKQEAETPSRPMTRGMQRLTRSASARMVSKYMNRNRTTETPKRKAGRRPKRKSLAKEIPMAADNPTQPPPPITPTATPQLLSSSSISSEYLQCAQKVPENLDVLELPGFRVPFTPSPATPNSLLLPSAFNLFSDSELVVPIVSQKQREIVVVSSSHDDSSHSQPTQSRRTRALKRKRNEDHHPQATPVSVSSSNFGSLISQQQQRQQNKSPDIFSNYSELSQMTLTQPQPFEGFKIFGSEVKQVQQQNAKTKPIGKKRRERSCLDILEQMFEPHRRPEKPANTQVMPTLPRRNLLEDEGDMDIFEITNNREFGSRLRLNSGGNVSPVQQQQQQQHHQQTQQASLRSPQQPNKITNYLISSGPTPEERTSTQMANVRKSPKSIRATQQQQQTTKLTRWFGATATGTANSSATNTQMSSGESSSAPTTPKGPSTSANAAAAMRAGRTSRSPTKRKRLDLYK
ncbi:uncharacterized protein Dwil_GK11263 [Drosophila willistoni]|uniref:SNF2 N-terminal domain-containing protein n=1 Tax=Drosophila willistoni TaxID=7260 RepID=B4N436_DROWI|nr:protein suppressor of underreplication [Drosophila willistoni]EDW78910.1 uncharacterized protein Dwil_GK11263 [Drosophila willistoni]